MRSQSPLPAAWEALTVPLKPVSNAQEHNLRLPAYPLWASCRVHHKFGLVAGFRIDLVHFRMPQGNHSRGSSALGRDDRVDAVLAGPSCAAVLDRTHDRVQLQRDATQPRDRGRYLLSLESILFQRVFAFE